MEKKSLRDKKTDAIKAKITVKKTMMEIKHVIDKCPNSYFANYDQWRDIGWAMHYENHSEECKKLFISKSRKFL